MVRQQRAGALIANVLIYGTMVFAGIVTLYPFIYVVSMSFSGPGSSARSNTEGGRHLPGGTPGQVTVT